MEAPASPLTSILPSYAGPPPGSWRVVAKPKPPYARPELRSVTRAPTNAKNIRCSTARNVLRLAGDAPRNAAGWASQRRWRDHVKKDTARRSWMRSRRRGRLRPIIYRTGDNNAIHITSSSRHGGAACNVRTRWLRNWPSPDSDAPRRDGHASGRCRHGLVSNVGDVRWYARENDGGEIAGGAASADAGTHEVNVAGGAATHA
jgi:hypothetical protein